MPENEGLAKNAFYSPYCCVYNTTVNSMGFREKNITPEKLKRSQCTGRLFLRTHGSVAVGDVRRGLGHPQEHLSLCWHFLTRGLGCAARSSHAGHGHDAKTRPQHLHCVFPLCWIGKIKKKWICVWNYSTLPWSEWQNGFPGNWKSTHTNLQGCLTA